MTVKSDMLQMKGMRRVTIETMLTEEDEWPPINEAIADWYYVDNGMQRGPVTAAVIVRLLTKRKIDTETQVWRSGLEGWVPLGDSELNQFAISMPPPVSGELVSNLLVWLVALLPLALTIFETYLIILPNPIRLDGANLTLVQLFPDRAIPVWVFMVLNSFLCLWDDLRLGQGGNSSIAMTIAAVVLAPAYLFMRANKLRQWPSYAWVWTLFFVTKIMFLTLLRYD